MIANHDLDESDGVTEDISEEGVKADTVISDIKDLSSTKVLDIPYEDQPFDLLKEAKLLLNIALPAVAVQLSVFFIFPQTASVVGRMLGTDALAGFSLGSLVGNLTCLSVMVGTMAGADTLMPRAYGAKDYKELGRLAIRGAVICTVLLAIPVVPLCTIMELIFDVLGQDKGAAHLAAGWIRVYLISVPPQIIFRVIQSFLNAQHQTWPLVFASLFSCFVVHPIFLKIFVPTFGFIGSSIALTMTQFVMILLLVGYLYVNPVFKPESWPGLSLKYFNEAIRPDAMMTFFSLSLGGVLTLSEWWFWEIVCFIVGSFGVVPLCVHTIAYNLVPLFFMVPLGMMIGLTVRMGNIIAYSVKHAKLMAAWCMLFTVILGAIATSLLYFFRVEIAMLFTNDEEVIQGCKEIWHKLCIYIFILYIHGINSAIHKALGTIWTMAVTIVVCCFGALPLIVVFGIQKGGELHAIWTILPILYSVMQCLLAFFYLKTDWHEVSRKARLRKRLSEADVVPLVTEETSLIEHGT